ncbi:MAG: mitofilin family membrane protein [Rhizomicrobium sp.]
MSATDSAVPPPQAPTHTVHVVHPAPSRFSGLGMIALLIGVVVVLGVTALFLWQMRRQGPQQSLSLAAGEQGDIASLRDRLAADEARLALLEKAGTGGGAVSQQAQADLASLSARIGKLETAPDPQATARLDDLERRLSAMQSDIDLRVAALERNALGSDMPQRLATVTDAEAALEARVAKMENTQPSVVARNAAAELALANLIRVSGTDQPFAAELQTFRVLLPNAPEAGELAPIALHGAPTQATLRDRFPAMAAKALEDENRAKATTWLGRLWANIGNLIVIRRTGERQGADSEAILARAGAALDKNDLDGALVQMKSLKGAARASASDWMHDALARQAIRQDGDALALRLSRVLSAP